MQKHFNGKEKVTLRYFQQGEIIKVIALPKNKALTFKDISVKIMFKSVHVYFQALTKNYQRLCKSWNFPEILVYADITPAF